MFDNLARVYNRKHEDINVEKQNCDVENQNLITDLVGEARD